MSNFYGKARTNLFMPVSYDGIKAWAERLGWEVWKEEGGVVLGSGDGGIPNEVYNEDTDEFENVDFIPELQMHLADGAVCVLQTVGFEKLRYLHGVVYVITRHGVRERSIHAYDDLITELGGTPADVSSPTS